MNSKVKFKLKTPFIFLSIIALVFRMISSLGSFVNYDYIKYHYEMNVVFPSFGSLIYLIIYLAPIVLFLIYALKLYKKIKVTICMPIVFGLIALAPIYNFFIDFMAICNNIASMQHGFNTDVLFGVLLVIIVVFIRMLFIAVPLVVATISALKGFSKKSFTIIAFVIVLLNRAFSILSIVSTVEYYLESEFYIHLITVPCGFLGAVLFYIALFLFAMSLRKPTILMSSPKQNKKCIKKMSPEQDLIMLKDRFDFGIISEEEYQSQRAEIINKL